MFVHLHGHTYWSLLDGAAPPKELFERAAALGMPGIAVTDHGTMYGTAECYLMAKEISEKTGKPFRFIPGVEAYVAPRSRFDKEKHRGDDANWHLVLWALDNIGLSMLYRLVSRTELYYRPRIDKTILAEIVGECGEGHIAGSSACLASEINRHILQGNYASAKDSAYVYQEILGRDNFFLELQDHGLEEQRLVNRELLRMHKETKIPLIVTNDYHYVEPEHGFLHDVVVCIQTGKQLADDDRMQFESSEAYLKSPREMFELFPDQKQAYQNTLDIAERCRIELDFETVHLPHFDLPEGYSTAEAYLKHLTFEGARWRFGEITQNIVERLEYELNTINNMGYDDYFLIVWDFVRFAKDSGIPVGPGRGSAAGSLVAYCLGITNIDPLRYDLLFERFLNPARVTLPDVDMDFCYHRRNEVIEYVVKKYGADRTAQIITFGTLKARGAVRDVARVLGVPLRKADTLAKAIPFGSSLKDALAAVPELQSAYKEDSEAKQVLETAGFLEGFPRHASTHAAGVVIAPRPLELDIPLNKADSDKAVTPYTTQYPMDILEAMKFLKVDFLALRNLSVIQETVNWVNRLATEELDMESIPLDDPKTFQTVFQKGLTGGVFQFESEGMRRLLQDFQPESLEHLTLLNAMYRPGPMQYIPTIIRRRKGQEAIKWPHPMLEDLLKETYGIMAYQEQVMAVANSFAGFSLGEADLLRRAIGRKDQKTMDASREEFIRGAVQKGHSEHLAKEIYKDIEKFAGYGFNKSHACAYALIAFQTAYLKTHHPTEFMAALLTSVMGKDKNTKLGEYLVECKEMGIKVEHPNINASHITFVPKNGNTICFGLSAIKNVGESAAANIIENRKVEPYQSLIDLCGRVHLSRDAILSLIRVGALDDFNKSRAELEASLDGALKVAANRRRQSHRGQAALFDFGELDMAPLDLSMGDGLPEYDEYRRLQYERELIGVYLSGHPLDQHADRLKDQGVITSRDLEHRRHDETVVVAGIVTESRRIITRRSEEMAFITLEDQLGPVEIIVFPQLYSQYHSILNGDSILIVQGRNDSSVEEREEPPTGEFEEDGEIGEFQAKIIANAIYRMEEWLPGENPKKPHGPLIINADGLSEAALVELQRILQAYPGPLPVILSFLKPRAAQLALPKKYGVNPKKSQELVDRLEGIVGKHKVEWSSAAAAPTKIISQNV